MELVTIWVTCTRKQDGRIGVMFQTWLDRPSPRKAVVVVQHDPPVYYHAAETLVHYACRVEKITRAEI